MQLARGALALIVLVTIAAVVPGVVRARVVGEAPVAAAWVDEPELGGEVEGPEGVAAPVVVRVVVEVAVLDVSSGFRGTGILLCAPKTSPPGERRSWV